MARYRKVDVRIRADAKFRRLSRPQPNGQSLWLHLLTGSHTGAIPGLSAAGEAAMAEELGWSLEGFREAFREVFREGMAKADWEARVVWVPNVIKYDKPQSPNVVRSWRTAWDETPECALKTEAWHALKAFLEGLGEAFAKAFAEACPKPLANPEPEPEPEPSPSESVTRAPRASTKGKGKRDLSEVAAVVRQEIALLAHAEYPPASFDALEARLRDKDMTGEEALALVRWAATDQFWGGQVRLDPSTLFRPKHWPGLLAKSKAGPASTPTTKPETDWDRRAREKYGSVS